MSRSNPRASQRSSTRSGTRPGSRDRDRPRGRTGTRSRDRTNNPDAANDPPISKPTPDTHSPYDDPHLYDILHAKGTREELAVVAQLANRHALQPTPFAYQVWIEPACGTARHLRAAIRADRPPAGTNRDRVIGIDTNASMLAFARASITRMQADDRAQLIETNMTSFARAARWKGTVGLCLVNSLRHLMTDRAVLAHMDSMSQALRAGGVYVVGLHMARYANDASTRDVYTANRGKVRLCEYVTCTPAPSATRRTERIDSVLRIGSPGRAEMKRRTYTLRTYSMIQWARLLAKSAMRPLAITDQDGAAIDIRLPRRTGDDGYRLWVLGRAADTAGSEFLTPEAVKDAD